MIASERTPAGPCRPHIDPAARARQFMPFAALKGYYELVRTKERIVQPRHELTDEEAFGLSQQVACLSKGDMVRVVHYDTDAYVTAVGMVARIDMDLRILTVVKTKIPFSDIRSIERISRDGLSKCARLSDKGDG